MNNNKITKVLIVDDSHLMCKVLTDVLNSDPSLIVSGVANNGRDAVELTKKIKPDIITMDVHMPLMDGIAATEQIMAYCPTPILIVSSSTPKPGEGSVFDAINNGALDFIEKNGIEFYCNKINRKQLIERIKCISRIKVITHPKGKLVNKRLVSQKTFNSESSAFAGDRIVAIASSTGGTEALSKILQVLPDDFPCPIVIVQHMTSGFDEDFASWLNGKSGLKVKLAEDSEYVMPGHVYIAPADYQMRISPNKKVVISAEPSVNGHCPSGDVLLESVASVYKEQAIGVILTGMGKDGALGLKTIFDNHGNTIAQDEKSCVIFGMPKVAIDLGGAEHIVPLQKIADKLLDII